MELRSFTITITWGIPVYVLITRCMHKTILLKCTIRMTYAWLIGLLRITSILRFFDRPVKQLS